MKCEIARDLMLEADLSALRGEGDRELSQHLRSCAACRARAARILDQTGALGAALERVAPRTPATGRPRLRPVSHTPRARRWAIAVPLALAASLAVLLLDRTPPSPPESRGAQPPALAAALEVEAAPGRAVTVFQTDNPNIVIIWSF